MRAFSLQLRVAPRRALAAGVLSQVDLVRARLQGGSRSRRVEVDLRHFPVALVLVGEVVERVVDPVLDSELPRAGGIGRDVGVDARRSGLVPFAELLLVVAAGLERVPRKVEVVALTEPPQVSRGRGALHDRAPRVAQQHSFSAQHDVHAGRPKRLAFSARLLLALEEQHRRVALRQSQLRRFAAFGLRRRRRERQQREHAPGQPPRSAPGARGGDPGRGRGLDSRVLSWGAARRRIRPRRDHRPRSPWSPLRDRGRGTA